MSLVLEALRRVEKPDTSPGSIGVAVTSFAPRRPKTGAASPLLLGLLCGGAFIWLLGPPSPSPSADANRGAPSTVRPAIAMAVSTSSNPLGPVDPSLATPDFRAKRLQLMNQLRALAGAPAPRLSPPRPDGVAAKPIGAPAVNPSPASAPAPANTPPPLVLQAISRRDSHPIAIINDQLVKEGDLIGSAQVLKIGTESVEVLRPGGAKETVRFAPPPEPVASPTPL